MTEAFMTICMTAVISLIIGAVLGPLLIPVLTRLKFGQEIREIGPSWHKNKSGTPTMGGIIFIASAIVSALIFSPSKEVYLLAGISLAFGIIGFVDDFIKVVMKRNLGLTEIQKFALQLVASVIFIIVGIKVNAFDTTVIIPIFNTTLDLGWLYFPFALFVIVGATNSVNLTDGLDGLAASVTAVVCIFFTIKMSTKCKKPFPLWEKQTKGRKMNLT